MRPQSPLVFHFKNAVYQETKKGHLSKDCLKDNLAARDKR